jgi:hypothetical protein
MWVLFSGGGVIIDLNVVNIGVRSKVQPDLPCVEWESRFSNTQETFY